MHVIISEVGVTSKMSVLEPPFSGSATAVHQQQYCEEKCASCIINSCDSHLHMQLCGLVVRVYSFNIQL